MLLAAPIIASWQRDQIFWMLCGTKSSGYANLWIL